MAYAYRDGHCQQAGLNMQLFEAGWLSAAQCTSVWQFCLSQKFGQRILVLLDSLMLQRMLS